MESFSNIINVLGVQTTERNSTICSHVNVMLILQFINLFGGQTSVSEHTNLVGHMTPVMSASSSLQLGNQSCSHIFNSCRHIDQILMPASSKLRITQNNIDNSCSMNWWIRVHWSCNTFDSRLNFFASGFI